MGDDRSEEKVAREVLDALHEGCQVIGFDYTYLYVNEAVVAQGRSTPEALLGFGHHRPEARSGGA